MRGKFNLRGKLLKMDLTKMTHKIKLNKCMEEKQRGIVELRN